jgi:hypothetical protein
MLNDVPRVEEASEWNETHWRSLLLAIQYNNCTPFLGAGACSDVLPTGRQIAEQWAKDFDYPFPDRSNLVRVAQYLAVLQNGNFPKYLIREELEKRAQPDFNDEGEPHRVLAEFPFPIYITTNYDSFMVQALERQNRKPTQYVCKWHLAGRRQGRLQAMSDPLPEPTAENPLVFHLHGLLREFDTMVLTEDDYIDFLANMSEERDLIPRPVMDAISRSHLLFMGYSLEDLNFKVLFRRVARYMRRDEGALHVAVQLEPKGDEPTDEEIRRALLQRKYLEKKYRLWSISFFWGSCKDFAAELRRRWKPAGVHHVR